MNQFTIQPKPLSKPARIAFIFFTLLLLLRWGAQVLMLAALIQAQSEIGWTARDWWHFPGGIAMLSAPVIVEFAIYALFLWWLAPWFHTHIAMNENSITLKKGRKTDEFELDEIKVLQWDSKWLIPRMNFLLEDRIIRCYLLIYTPEDQFKLVHYFRDQVSSNLQSGWENFHWKYVEPLLPETLERHKTQMQDWKKSNSYKLRILMLSGLWLIFMLGFTESDIATFPLILPLAWCLYSSSSRTGFLTAAQWKEGFKYQLCLSIPFAVASLTGFCVTRCIEESILKEFWYPIMLGGFMLLLLLIGLHLTKSTRETLLTHIIELKQTSWNKLSPTHFDSP